jgi:hypothetical protein
MGGMRRPSGSILVQSVSTEARHQRAARLARQVTVVLNDGDTFREAAKMAKFITVTLDNTTDEVTVNADKIIKFWRWPNMNYTVIDLDGEKNTLTVKETPHQITGKLA